MADELPKHLNTSDPMRVWTVEADGGEYEIPSGWRSEAGWLIFKNGQAIAIDKICMIQLGGRG